MKITTDIEGLAAIKSLCDIALKAGGIQNLNPITNILRTVEMFEKCDSNPEGKEEHGCIQE